MGILDSFGKIAGLVTGCCTIGGIVIGGVAAGLSYKARIDSIDGLQVRIAQLEARTGGTGMTGPEGARGPEGKPGKQGEVGPQGERGPPGPKGDRGEAGIALQQVAEFDRRLVALEKRLALATRPAGVQFATADDAVVPMPKGIQRNAEGCYFLAPGFDTASATFVAGDKLCTVDGRPGLTITRVGDDALYWEARNAGYSDVRCQVQTDPRSNCGSLVFNVHALWAARSVKMDATGKIRVNVEFKAQ